MADKAGAKRGGRYTAPANRRQAGGRYTEPTPRSVTRSPRWYPWAILTLLFVGVLAVILNYIQVLPYSPTNWYTIGGLVSIVFGALLATRYR